MSKVAYLAGDWFKNLGASAIAITNEDTNYPEANMQNEQIALQTRTTNKASIKIQFDLGSAKQPQAFFIGNHNFSGGTFDINSYTANDYSTGKTAVEANKAVRLLDVYHRESSAPTARQYWEYDLSSVTSADSVYKIGRAMCYSDVTQITEYPDYITPRGYGFRNVVNQTKYGVRWSHKLMEKRERFLLAWNERLVTNNPTTELRTLYEAVYGDASPFLYIPDLANTDCYYMYIEDPEFVWSEIMGTGADAHVGNLSLPLIEAVRGKSA